jgi:hypothetical protein
LEKAVVVWQYMNRAGCLAQAFIHFAIGRNACPALFARTHAFIAFAFFAVELYFRARQKASTFAPTAL